MPPPIRKQPLTISNALMRERDRKLPALPAIRAYITSPKPAITMKVTPRIRICCIGLPVLRKRQGLRADVVTAPNSAVVVGVIGAVVMAVLAVVMPLVAAGGWPPVFWIFPAWTAIGTVVLLAMRRT